MSQMVDDVQQPEIPAELPDYAQQQRQVLEELERLSEQCNEREKAVEQARQERQATARQRFDRAKRKLRERRVAQRKIVERDHAQRTTELEQQRQKQQAEADQIYKKAQGNLHEKVEVSEQKARQQLNSDMWLSESVYEAAVAEADQKHKKAKRLLAERQEAIDQLVEQTVDQFRRYRLSAPAVGEHVKQADKPAEDKLEQGYAAALEAAGKRLRGFASLFVPGLFRGLRPWMLTVVLTGLAGAGGYLYAAQEQMETDQAVLWAVGAGGAMLVLVVVVGALLRLWGKKIVVKQYEQMRAALEQVQQAARTEYEQVHQATRKRKQQAKEQRDADQEAAQQKHNPNLQNIEQKRDALRKQMKEEYEQRCQELTEAYESGTAQAQQEHKQRSEALEKRYEDWLNKAEQRFNVVAEAAEAEARQALAEMESQWKAAVQRIEQLVSRTQELVSDGLRPWKDPAWRQWEGDTVSPGMARFGLLGMDPSRVASEAAVSGRYGVELPQPFDMPALLAYPQQGSLLIEHDHAGRDVAIGSLQSVVARLLTCLPAGRAHFTFIDPVGLGQNFAGFMHLVDYNDQLVNNRIWTDSEQIEQRLTDLTDHMEDVIQKYLRNEYETIDEYNAQAGELAEPYRFVVLADFPNNVSEEAARRLNAILKSGTRCGVYALIAHDTRQVMPTGLTLEDLRAQCTRVVQQKKAKDEPAAALAFKWEQDLFEPFDMAVDAPPDEPTLLHVVHKAGEKALEAGRVEIPFSSTAPKPEQYWTADCTDELRVPIGRSGATRIQELRFGKGVAQHALVAGKTGSGKSTMLHVLVSNLALWYSPQQVEFYLIDFKKGVEFKTYATHNLPHARAVAIESDREFGLSVLQRLDAELERRGEMFRKQGVQSLAEFRRAVEDEPMPRTLLLIDEFQELFSHDDKVAQDAAMLLDRLVRQGRAFGIHLMLGSQTIGGAGGLSRSTIGQMAVRVALQCNEADSQMIFDDSNTAARLLTRPGEAIYNDAGGMMEGNSPFQVTWLSESERERYLADVSKLASERCPEHGGPIVFEGNAPADLSLNVELGKLLSNPPAEAVRTPRAWLGEPITIKEPTAMPMQRQSGANMLVVGQRDEAATALLCSSLVSLAAQHPVGAARFYVFDATPSDSPLAGTMERVAELLPHDVKVVGWRETESAFGELGDLLQRRQDNEMNDPHPAPVYVLVNGLQRYRMLRKSEDELGFSFSMGGGDDDDAGAPAGAKPDKVLVDLLRDGPGLGMHVLTWIDTVLSLERTLDRQALREFDFRVLFQMSASDSSNLIDSPMGNQLGQYRGLLYSEEQGIAEKFRPYALPESRELAWLGEKFGGWQVGSA